MRAAGIADLATDARLLPFGRGQDFTIQLLFDTDSISAPAPSVALLPQLCKRLPQAARFLGSRREGKRPYKIADEYDVQDLLHAVIRAYFKYSVDEEPLGKVGGGRSARADLALPDVNTLIEVKFVREPKDQQRIVEEFAQYLLLYTAWAPLQTFLYLIYNSADLRDPETMKTPSKMARSIGLRLSWPNNAAVPESSRPATSTPNIRL
jgi:REase_DpnII-MboI